MDREIKIVPDGEGRFFGRMKGQKGVMATGRTPEEARRSVIIAYGQIQEARRAGEK